MTHDRALTIIRASAVYDLLATVLFALPVTATWLLAALHALHENLGLTGVTPDAGNVFTLMFANLMGSVVSVWALFRIVRPTIAAGVADTGARVLFSLGMIAALVGGGSPLVLVMLALEVAWGIVQGIAVLRVRRDEDLREPVGGAATTS